jgi:hypothetical protein
MTTFFKKTLVKNPIAAILLFCLSCFSFNANAFVHKAGEVTIPAGTRIDLETMSTINSSTIQAGETVDFKVRTDISVEGQVVIKAGSVAKGTVVSASKAKGIGKEGSVEIQVKSVNGVDGKMIPLSGAGVARTGDNNQVLSIVLGIFVCLLFLLIKGSNGIIPAGTSTDAVVASNTKVAV